MTRHDLPSRRVAARLPVWLTQVQSRSMEPTLRHGQLVVTTTLRGTGAVRRSDLVVLESPELGRRVVKRVIGLPGDLVRIRDGTVHVNGRPRYEPYAARSVFNGVFRVPEGSYFLLGDNRDASSDSRTWTTPYISRSRIVGRLHLFSAPGRGTLRRWRSGSWGLGTRSAAAAGSRPASGCGATV